MKIGTYSLYYVGIPNKSWGNISRMDYARNPLYKFSM